jgi:putative MATE family efflux protein
VLASQALRIAYQWVDALWVSGLGVHATAAVTTSIFAMWWVYSLTDVVALGVVAYVAQLLGAGDRPRAGVAAYKALLGTALMGTPAILVGLFGTRALFALLGATPEVVQAGGDYLGLILCFAPLPMMALTCEGIMRGAGDTRTPLLIDLAAVGLNAVLDPLLIFGVGPFPRLGVAGAAWATVIAQGTMLAAYLGCAARRHRAFPLQRRAPGLPVRVAGLLRVGVPAASIGILFSLVYLVFARIAAGFGPAAMAVVGVVNRIEAISYLASFSLGSAAAVLVGQNLGAGRPERAERAVRVGVRWAVWAGLSGRSAPAPNLMRRWLPWCPSCCRPQRRSCRWRLRRPPHLLNRWPWRPFLQPARQRTPPRRVRWLQWRPRLPSALTSLRSCQLASSS